MQLLVDLDGVVVEYDFPKLVKQYFKVDLARQQIYAYDMADVLGVSNKSIDDMFKEQVFGRPNFIPGALETLQGWYGEHEIVIFSNRVKYMGFQGLSKWLKGNKIPFDTVYHSGEYDFHIDDSPAKLMNINSKTKLLFNQPWNEGCLNIEKKLKRVFNWVDIEKEVSDEESGVGDNNYLRNNSGKPVSHLR